VWIQDFGNVFGLGFTLEGFSFFVEAIFIGIYVYGWDRLQAPAHFLSGLPIALAGITGSMFVIAVNAWMNHPTGFRLAGGRAVDAHPWSALFANPFFWSEYVHMYFAGYIVCGFLMAGAYAWAILRGRQRPVRADRAGHLAVRGGRGRAAAGRGGRLGGQGRGAGPAGQAGRAGRAGRPPGARPSTCSAGTTGTRWCTGSRSRGCSRCSPSTTRTPRSRG
jgi:Cytochrome bd-type quinol oxidase, subunit 1